MKKRALTSVAIVVVLALAFVLKMLVSDYFFDAFILIITCFACFEQARLMRDMDKPCYKYLAIAFPIVIYINHLFAFLFNSVVGLGWAIIIDICIAVIFFVCAFFYGLIFTKKIKREIRLKKLENVDIKKLALSKALNTLVCFVYPAFLLLFLTFVNHFAAFTVEGGTFANLGATDAYWMSFVALLFMFVIPASTDTFAYLWGGAIGGKKLCPKISPQKTISGAIGGLLSCILCCCGLYLVLNAIPTINTVFASVGFSLWQVVIISIVLSVVAQMGDIFESYLKRKANVKDSGKILPGHGGMLDRCDSHIFVAPLLMLCFSIILLLV